MLRGAQDQMQPTRAGASQLEVSFRIL